MDSYRVSTVDVPESPIGSDEEILDSSSGVTPCIVVKNVGVLYHKVSSFSPECWTKVVCRYVQRLPPALEVQRAHCYPISVVRHNEHHLHSTFTLDEENHSFYWRFKYGSYVRAQVSFIETIRPIKSSPSLWYRSNKACANCIAMLFCRTSEISWVIQRSAS